MTEELNTAVPIIPSSPTLDEEDVPSKLVEGEDGEEEQEIQLEPTQEEMEKERLTNRAEQLQDEILELRKTLQEKEQELAEVKHKLGITPFVEFKQSVAHGWKVMGNKWKEVQETETYHKIDDKLSGWKTKIEESQAYQKTKAALSDGSKKASGAVSSAGTKIKENETVKAIGEKTSSALKRTGTALKDTATSLKEKMKASFDAGDEKTEKEGASGQGETVVPDEPLKKE